MADSRDITGKNRKFTGTDGIVLPKGTQAERADTESGEIRFNTDTNLAEYYDGTEWKPIDAPPTITGVSPASPVDDGSTVTEITITGSNLQAGGTLTIIGNDATSYPVASFTRVSSSSITFNYTSALAAAGVNTPYDIKYENPSGLAATFEDGFTPNTGPVWVSPAAGSSLGSINLGANASTLTQISVTDTSGGTLVYSIISGALPDGATINSSTGAISGVTTVSGTFTFTIQVTDGSTAIDRQFSATIINPYVEATGGTVLTSGDYKTHIFTSDSTFVVSNAGTPSGSNTVEYLVVAGGGSGANGDVGGGGGAGGMRYNYPSPATGGLSVTATTYPIQVGGGANGVANNIRGNNGQSSIFSNITSAGGGGGGVDNNPPGNGKSGGSGGGAGWAPPTSGGSGNTPPVSPPQGQPGGNNPPGTNGPSYIPGGGGGHSQAGYPGGYTGQYNSGDRRGRGGDGTQIANAFFGPTAPSYGTPGPTGRYFAGGGGASSDTSGDALVPGGLGGGGAGSQGPGTGSGAGTANTGGGSGGGANAAPGVTANGGSGIVAIRYKFQ